MQVDLKRYPMADIEKRYSSTVQSGGMWSPEVTREGEQTCRSRHRIAVVVPYRLYFGPVVLCPVHIVLWPSCTLSRVYFVPLRDYSGSTAAYTPEHLTKRLNVLFRLCLLSIQFDSKSITSKILE